MTRKTWLWVLAGGLVAMVLIISLLFSSSYLSTQTYTGEAVRPPSNVEVVFAPLISLISKLEAGFDVVVYYVRPSTIRDGAWCELLPSRPDRVGWQWLTRLSERCAER